MTAQQEFIAKSLRRNHEKHTHYENKRRTTRNDAKENVIKENVKRAPSEGQTEADLGSLESSTAPLSAISGDSGEAGAAHLVPEHLRDKGFLVGMQCVTCFLLGSLLVRFHLKEFHLKGMFEFVIRLILK